MFIFAVSITGVLKLAACTPTCRGRCAGSLLAPSLTGSEPPEDRDCDGCPCFLHGLTRAAQNQAEWIKALQYMLRGTEDREMRQSYLQENYSLVLFER